jgi:serine protease Do
MKRQLMLLCLIFLLPVCPVAECVMLPVSIGDYPIPSTELREHVIEWLHGTGYRVSQKIEDSGEFNLECSRDKEMFLIKIRPHSPLASLAEISGVVASSPLVSDLKKSLVAYVQNLQGEGAVTGQDIPRSVRDLEQSTFCLTAIVGGETVAFSGFSVDRSGLIVSTAHDLDSTRDIVVRLDSGEEIVGKVVKRDALRDLSLIKVAKKLAGSVPVNKGRRKLNTGDRVFSVVCPAHNHVRVRTGIVDEPPAMVNGQPLWQVNMDVTHGDSGGPVFDFDGRLVGVVKGRYRGGWSRGFLIPVTTLRGFLGLGVK